MTNSKQSKGLTAVGRRRTKPERADVAGGQEEPRRSGPWPARWLLVPVVAAVAVWVAAAVARIDPPASVVPVVLMVLAGLIGAGVAAWKLVSQRSVPKHRRRGTRRAVFAIAAITVAMLWLIPAAVAGPWTMPLLPAWIGATTAAVVAWSRTAWCRHRMRADADVRAWPVVSKKLDVAGSVLRAILWTRAGRSLRIELAEGQTWRQIRPDVADSVLGVAPGAVTVERDLTSARLVTMHVQDLDPWSQGDITHPIQPHLEALEATRVKVRSGRVPTIADLPNFVEDPDTVAPWLPASATVTEPLPIGERATGDPAGMPLYKAGRGAIHWLIGGQTGGGKSVLMRDITAGLFRCCDVVVWGIDTAKQGKAFGPWAKYMRVARTLAEAEQMLADARVWIGNSAQRSAQEAEQGQGADNVEPSPQRPMLVILIDEAADVFDATNEDSMGDRADLKYRCVEHAERIGATGRSEAAGMVVMTQRPDSSSLGGDSRLRSHFFGGGCLRTTNQSEMQWVLQGEGADDLDPSVFRYEGLLYLQDGPDIVPSPIRSYALTDPETCARIADVLGIGLPPVPEWLLAGSQDTGSYDTDSPDNHSPDHGRHGAVADDAGDPGTQLDLPHGVTVSSDPDELGSDSTETTMNQQPAQQPKNRDVRATRDAIRELQTELNKDLDIDEDTEVPAADLTAIAQHHQAPVEQIDPADQNAAQALLNTLTHAGDEGLTRANVANHADVDQITTQRLLGQLERLGHVTGDSGVGPQVRWRIVARTTANGQHTSDAGHPADQTPREEA